MKRMISIILFTTCLGILCAGADTSNAASPVQLLESNNGIPGFPIRSMKSADANARIAQGDEYGTPLVVNAFPKGGVDWSPDGAWIAYEQNGNIYVMPSTGGTATLVTPALGGANYHPRFTPDSNAISFTNYDTDFEYFSIIQVYFKDNALPYETILFDAFTHAFSSDGNLIAYRIASTSELAVYNRSEDSEWIIASGDYDSMLEIGYGSPCFSPDDSHVITGMVNVDGGMTLYSIPTEGGTPEMLTEVGYELHNYPHFSPDGRWILFTDEYFGDLHAYDTDSGDWTQMYPDTEYYNVYGRFSPAGNKFVYLLMDYVDESSVYNVYTAPFTLSGPTGAISLTNPVGGEYFAGGDGLTIQWQVPYIAVIRLEFSLDGGTNWELIDRNIPSTDGSYQWTLPFVQSEDCLIRISTMTNSAADVSGLFTIETAGEPAASLLSPGSGDILTGGSSYHIQWESSHVDVVKLEFSSNYGSTWSLIDGSIPAMYGGYDWIVPSTVDSDGCIIRIAMTDGAQLDLSGTFTVTPQGIDPYIDIVTPSGGEQWQAGTNKDIVWMTNLSSVSIWYSDDNKATWNLIVENYTTDNASTTQSYTWTVPNTASQTCYIRINDENDTDVSDVNRTPLTIMTSFTPLKIYSYDTGASVYFSSPAIDASGTVYIGTELNELIAVNPDGTYKWSTYFDDTSLTGATQIWASPAINNGTIYIGSLNGYLYALNMTNGSIKWRYNAKEQIISSAAIGYDGSIYFGTNMGSFIGLNPDGSSKFTKVSLGTPILSSPAIGIDGSIYIGGYDGYVYAFNADGSFKWEYGTGRETIFSSPAIGSDGTIYISTSSIQTSSIVPMGYLYALSPEGVYKWSKFTGTQVYGSPAIGEDGTIYIGSTVFQATNLSYTGRLSAINPQNGSIVWTVNADSEIISTPAVASDGTIYIGTATADAGNLLAVSNDGSVKWHFSTDDWITSSPTIGTDGQVYFGSYDGYLYAIQGAPGTTLAASTWPKFRRNALNTGRVAENAATSFVRVISPNGGETYTPGTSLSITWNSRSVDTVLIEVSTDGGETYTEIGQKPASAGSATWDIPTATTNTSECLIRISDTENSTITDESDERFSITQAAFVEVLNPSGGEQFRVGTQQTIKWNANAVEKLDLAYSTDGGANWVTIDTEVAGSDGQYTWTIPDAVSADCVIRIMKTGDDSISDISSGVFAITSGSYIEVTAPAFGDTWGAGSTRTVTWSFSGPTNVKIELSTDGGATWEVIVASTPALTGSYSWSVPTSEKEVCFIRITDTANAETVGISAQFSITTPTLSIDHTPIDHASENDPITFTALVSSTAEIDTVTLHYDVTGERQFTTHTVVMDHVSGDTYRCTIEQGVFTAEGIEYYIRARDKEKRVARTPDTDYYSIAADISNINSELTVSGGSAQTSYRMVSVPMNLNQTTMNMQLRDNHPTGDNGADWRLFWYDASVGSEADRYVEFVPGETVFGGFEPGKAFWLISSSNYRLSSLSGTTVSTAESYTITLQSGWNDIANPWMFDISWDDIENPSGADLSVLYEYNGSWSDATSPPTELKPWRGYAVLNNTNRNVVIKLHPIPAGTGKVTAEAADRSIVAKPAADQGWMLRLDAQAGEARDQATYLGVCPGALVGKDAFDHAEPPPVGGFVAVSFPHPEWETKAEDYTVDMRSVDILSHTWDFDVTTSVEQEPVVIQIDGLESLPEGTGLVIIDRDTGLPIAIQDGMFSFLSGHDITERHFALTIDTVEQLEQRGLSSEPVAFLTARCYPNPFNPATTIQYALPQMTQVTIEIFNTLGQRIREFDLGLREAGTHEFYFNAEGLTTGLYIYRVRAGSQDVTDKMLLMK